MLHICCACLQILDGERLVFVQRRPHISSQKNSSKMCLCSSSHAFTKLIQMRHIHVKWPHLHLKIDDEELKKTRDGTYGMAIIHFIILLLLILYDPGFACHSDNFMSLV